MQLLANIFQDIRISCRPRYAKTFELTWSSSNLDETSVLSSALCFAAEHILGSPFRLIVSPGVPSQHSIQIVAFDKNVSVGEQFSARLWAGDTFNNSVSGISSNLVLTLRPPGNFNSRSLVVPVHEGQISSLYRRDLVNFQKLRTSSIGYSAVFPATTKIGTHSMFASLALVGGLSATYFGDSNFMIPLSANQDAPIDFSGAGTSPSFGLSPARNETRSIRWIGLVRSESAGIYSIFSAQQSPNERVKLWIEFI